MNTDKIAIIGSPGAGKSTLAQQLGMSLNMEIIHLDRYFWRPDWREKPRDARIAILKDLVRKERWIIEGTYLGASEPRLNAAVTIIFLDIPPLCWLLRTSVQKRGEKKEEQSSMVSTREAAQGSSSSCLRLLASQIGRADKVSQEPLF